MDASQPTDGGPCRGWRAVGRAGDPCDEPDLPRPTTTDERTHPTQEVAMSGEMTAPSSTTGAATGAGGPPTQQGGGPGSGSDASSMQEKVGATVEQTGEEARHLVDEGKEQLRSLSGDARSAMRERVDERTSTIAASLAGMADDLETMAGSTQDEGPLPTAAHQLAGVARNASRRLEEGGAEGVVDDVRSYARRRPGVFLGVAFGLGIVAGRLLRGDIDERKDGSPYAFTSQRGPRLTEAGIHHWFRNLKASANKGEWDLIEAISYHDLRHDFAHRARAAGWNLEEIAYYLGHITKRGTPAVQTTVRYTQASREQIKAKLTQITG